MCIVIVFEAILLYIISLYLYLSIVKSKDSKMFWHDITAFYYRSDVLILVILMRIWTLYLMTSCALNIILA